MKKTTAFFMAAFLCSPMISHAVSTSASAAPVNGLIAQWVAEDYANTSSATAVSWTDRVSGIEASAIAANGVYPYLNADGNGVTFTRSGSTTTDAGSYFSVAANPVAGLSDYSVLVCFTPSATGAAGNGAFYKDSGLVGAEQAGVTNDWGLGYDSDGHVVAGYGISGGNDTTLDSVGTVAVGTQAIAGMTVNGTTLGSWINGTLSNSKTLAKNTARTNPALYIGRMGADGGWYAGDIAEIRIFNRALSASEMATYSDVMINGTETFTWESGTGSWGDANWTDDAGNTGLLSANSHAFVTGGTLTMAATPVVKSLTIGTGDASGTAVVNATADSLLGADSIAVIQGGTLNTSTVSTDVFVNGGTLASVSAVAGSTSNVPTLTLESGTFTITSNFNVGAYSGDLAGKVVVNGGTIKMANSGDYFCVGNRSTGGGEMIQNAGSVSVGWLTVGHKTYGLYELNGGTLSTTKITIGEGTDSSATTTSGNGTFTVNGGTLTNTGEFSVGTQSTGTLNLKSGSITTPTLTITGTGTFNSYGGTLTADALNLAGKLNYQSGTLNAKKLNVQTGGTFEISTNFNFGDSANTLYEIVVNGGTVTNSVESRNINIGNSGLGAFTVNSGTVNSKSDFNIGNSAGGSGALNINGGATKINSVNIGRNGTGVLNVTNGNFTTSYYLSIADRETGVGTAYVSGGKIYTPNLSVGNRGKGSYFQTAGFVEAKNYNVGESSGSTGDSTISSGVLKVTNASTISKAGTGTMTLTGNAIFNTPSLVNAQNLTFDGGTLMTRSVSGDLTQTGGKLVVGGTINEGLTWTLQDQTDLNDGFPGYTQYNSTNGWYAPSQDQVDAFWTKAQNATPVSSGLGAIGSGVNGSSYYSILYDGWIYVDKDDVYTFSFSADDGAFVYVDGEKVAEMSSMQRSDPWNKTPLTTSIELAAGWRHLDFRYYQGYGSANINSAIMTDSSGNVTDLKSLTNENFAMISYAKEITDLNITGNYSMGADAELFMDVDVASGTNDRIVATGDILLNGSLTIVSTGDYSGDAYEFQLFESGSKGLNFSEDFFEKINFEGVYDDVYYWDVTGLMTGGDGYLRLNYGSVPEPATYVLLLLGAFGIGCLRSRKNSKGLLNVKNV